jgi:hypothetical protein
MLDKLRSKPGGDRVQTHLGDMGGDLPPGPFALIYVATNTFFGLASVAQQARAFVNVAGRLTAGGRFVIDAFVPDDPPRSASMVEVQKVSVDRVVIAVSDADIAQQTAWGQMVEISETGIRMRPWRVRYSTPAELDAMASTAGLRVVGRYTTWDKDAFTEDSTNHVSVYGHSEPRG